MVSRHNAYSFYVPESDKELSDFVEAQSNLSFSIRLLLKGFIANCKEKAPDLAVMDLKALLKAADMGKDGLEGISGSARGHARTVPLDIGFDAEDDGKEGDEIISMPDDIGEEADAPEREAAAAPEPEAEAPDGREPETEPAQEQAEAEPASAGGDEIEPDPDPAPDPEAVAQGGTDDDDEDDLVPVVVTEEPKKKPADARAAYNEEQDGEEAGVDDIMSLMGGF